jgi:hypothetical protein
MHYARCISKVQVQNMLNTGKFIVMIASWTLEVEPEFVEKELL